ncbi:hypothetical protein B0T22DRAFT_465892 [Podospora appendiculata]|uniref:Uncharacterized protein n=1 Tax=Podospora appendiculata TaxID=314037 RepID=A0AAE0X5M6_9PEZI|nr:hypothetical protein B0T22DRAFT_465892 [Podospora appendiculata]
MDGDRAIRYGGTYSGHPCRLFVRSTYRRLLQAFKHQAWKRRGPNLSPPPTPATSGKVLVHEHQPPQRCRTLCPLGGNAWKLHDYLDPISMLSMQQTGHQMRNGNGIRSPSSEDGDGCEMRLPDRSRPPADHGCFSLVTGQSNSPKNKLPLTIRVR